MFRRFILPYMRKCIEQAKSYGLKVMLHSCGSIYRVIPDLLDAGVDALHPLQARAKGMDAETLARHYRGKLVFVGGVDTQHLLVHGSPQELRDEVRRLRDLWGRKFIVSPSHEAILPNVPAENVIAMAAAGQGVIPKPRLAQESYFHHLEMEVGTMLHKENWQETQDRFAAWWKGTFLPIALSGCG